MPGSGYVALGLLLLWTRYSCVSDRYCFLFPSVCVLMPTFYICFHTCRWIKPLLTYRVVTSLCVWNAVLRSVSRRSIYRCSFLHSSEIMALSELRAVYISVYFCGNKVIYKFRIIVYTNSFFIVDFIYPFTSIANIENFLLRHTWMGFLLIFYLFSSTSK